MKRHLMTLAFSAVVGSFLLAGSAQACHKKKAACAPAPCEQVVYSAPVQYSAPVYAAPQASGQYATPQASGQL